MFEKILQMTWADWDNCEYYFKSNTPKRIIEINTAQLNNGTNSDLLLYYSIVTGELIVCLCTGKDSFDISDIESKSNFKVTVNSIGGENEFIFVKKDVYSM